jgi:hypothetical protein
MDGRRATHPNRPQATGVEVERGLDPEDLKRVRRRI